MSTVPVPRSRGAAVRALRSLLVGLVVTSCAVSAHVAAGGRVGVATVVGLALGATAAAAVLTGRRLTTGQLLGLLALGQAALHLLGTSASHEGPMVAAHVAATGVSLLVLRRAEDLWWALADAVGATVRTPRVVDVPVVAHVVAVAATLRRGRRADRTVRGRAPPCAA